MSSYICALSFLLTKAGTEIYKQSLFIFIIYCIKYIEAIWQILKNIGFYGSFELQISIDIFIDTVK